MLDQILDLVKGQVADTLGGMPGVPEEKKSQAVETTAHSLLDGLKQYATSDNLSSITSMLGLGGSGSGMGAAPQGLESKIVSALTSKVGLSQPVAQKIASTVIPAVMSLFRKKVDDDNEPGFNLESLLGSLGGKNSGGSSGGGLMGMLGGMFGKKG